MSLKKYIQFCTQVVLHQSNKAMCGQIKMYSVFYELKMKTQTGDQINADRTQGVHYSSVIHKGSL